MGNKQKSVSVLCKMEFKIVFMCILILVFTIGIFLVPVKKSKIKIKIRMDSPMNLYKLIGGEADVWWNNTLVVGPDTINPQTNEPFISRHVKTITIKAIEVPIEVIMLETIATYSKLKIHPILGDSIISKEYTPVFYINDIDDNYYTLENITMK